MNREIVKDFYGRIIGYIETDTNGNKIGKDFYGRKLGSYDKKLNLTKDFYGRIISKGDTLTGLIFTAALEEENRKNVKK